MADRGSRALRPGGSAGRGTLGNHTASARRPRTRACDSSFRRIARMLDSPAISEFAHVKPADTEWRGGGLRDFFPLPRPRRRGRDRRPRDRPPRARERSARSGHGLAQAHRRFPHRPDAQGRGPLHVRGPGDACVGRRLRPPAPGNHISPSTTRPTWNTSKSSARRISALLDVAGPARFRTSRPGRRRSERGRETASGARRPERRASIPFPGVTYDRGSRTAAATQGRASPGALELRLDLQLVDRLFRLPLRGIDPFGHRWPAP